MGIVFVEIECLRDWGIGQIQAHQVEAEDPGLERPMVACKHGVGQIIQRAMTNGPAS